MLKNNSHYKKPPLKYNNCQKPKINKLLKKHSKKSYFQA